MIAAIAVAETETLTLTASPTTVTYGKTTALSGQLHTCPNQSERDDRSAGVRHGRVQEGHERQDERDRRLHNDGHAGDGHDLQVDAEVGAEPDSPREHSPAREAHAAGSQLVHGQRDGGSTLVGKSLVFQRFSTLRHKWVRVKNVTLTTAVKWDQADGTVLGQLPLEGKGKDASTGAPHARTGTALLRQ